MLAADPEVANWLKLILAPMNRLTLGTQAENNASWRQSTASDVVVTAYTSKLGKASENVGSVQSSQISNGHDRIRETSVSVRSELDIEVRHQDRSFSSHYDSVLQLKNSGVCGDLDSRSFIGSA